MAWASFTGCVELRVGHLGGPESFEGRLEICENSVVVRGGWGKLFPSGGVRAHP